MLIGTFLEVVGVGAVPAFLSIMVSPDSVVQIPLVGSIFKNYEITSAREIIIYSGLGLLFIYLAKNLYLSFLAYMKSKFIRNRKIELAQRMYTSYMRAPYALHLDRNTAELLRNANLEVRVVGNEVLNPLLKLILQTIITASIILLLLVIEPLTS